MDVAQKENGDWIIMELGDGQVAGLPPETSPTAFYEKLSQIFLKVV
ncbi:MAG: ATP-grasp domain-containing protein [Bacteroidota bacterium]